MSTIDIEYCCHTNLVAALEQVIEKVRDDGQGCMIHLIGYEDQKGVWQIEVVHYVIDFAEDTEEE